MQKREILPTVDRLRGWAERQIITSGCRPNERKGLFGETGQAADKRQTRGGQEADKQTRGRQEVGKRQKNRQEADKR
jgi:hypothetical protein